MKSTPSHEIDQFYLLVGDKLNTRTLLVVLECLKERAFHIQTVYVNSLDTNGIVWRLGNPQFRNASRVIWKFLDFSIIRSLFESIFSQDVAKEGR